MQISVVAYVCVPILAFGYRGTLADHEDGLLMLKLTVVNATRGRHVMRYPAKRQDQHEQS